MSCPKIRRIAADTSCELYNEDKNFVNHKNQVHQKGLRRRQGDLLYCQYCTVHSTEILPPYIPPAIGKAIMRMKIIYM